jgi:hypothetical protein
MCLVLSNDLFNIGAPAAYKLNKMDKSYERLLQAALELKNLKNPAEVARKLKITDQTIQNWKRRGVPDSQLLKIEKEIGALPAWIAAGSGEMTKRVSVDPSSLTEDQKQVLTMMETIRKDVLDAWIKVGAYLSGQTPERRKDDASPNEGRRFGEPNYKHKESIIKGNLLNNETAEKRRKEK